MIQRTIFQDLLNHLTKREISLIIGPRQAGKTTLMLLVQKYLKKKGAKTLFLSLDFESDQQFFTSQKNLIHKIEYKYKYLNNNPNNRAYNLYFDKLQ